MLVRIYGEAGSPHRSEREYSAAECCGTFRDCVRLPGEKHLSTSYIDDGRRPEIEFGFAGAEERRAQLAPAT